MDEFDQEPRRARLNARDTDAFDLGNLTFFPGPNLYLPRTALVFDLALTGSPPALPVAAYVEAVARVYPHLTGASFPDHAHLFAALVSLVSRLDLGLHLERFSVQPDGSVRPDRHPGPRPPHPAPRRLFRLGLARGDRRRASPSTMPAGWPGCRPSSTARPLAAPPPTPSSAPPRRAGSPPTYLRAEGLIQYGYGRRQVRGVSTTFSTDSQLDSGFTTRKDDCKAFLGPAGLSRTAGRCRGQPGRGDRGRGGDRLPGGGQAVGRPQGHRRHRRRPGRRRAGRGLRPRRRRAGRRHRRDQPRGQRLPPALRQRPLRRRPRAAAALGRGRRRVHRRAADRARERHARPRRQPRLAHGQDHPRRGHDRLHRAAGLHAPEHPGRGCDRPPAQGREPLGRRGQHRRDACRAHRTTSSWRRRWRATSA